MPLTRFISAKWQNPGFGNAPSILAKGDDGVDYYVADENSDVAPWPRFLAEGGEIEPPDPESEAK